MLDMLKSGQADVGVGALSITAERSKEIDFSHPFYDSGLDILVKGGSAPGPLDILVRLLTPSLVADVWRHHGGARFGLAHSLVVRAQA